MIFATHVLNKTIDRLIPIYPGIAPNKTLPEYEKEYGRVPFYGMYAKIEDQDDLHEPFVFLHFTSTDVTDVDFDHMKKLVAESMKEADENN